MAGLDDVRSGTAFPYHVELFEMGEHGGRIAYYADRDIGPHAANTHIVQFDPTHPHLRAEMVVVLSALCALIDEAIRLTPAGGWVPDADEGDEEKDEADEQ